MPVPDNIQELLNKIKESKDRWIALYTSTWNYQAYNSRKRENTRLWEEPVVVGLPAREHRNRIYTYKSARDLDKILRDRDGEIALNHTVTLFSLLEKLAKEIHKHETGQYPTDFNKRSALANFLKGKGFLLPAEEKEFALVKETRNCVVHHGHMIEDKWRNAWKDARGNATIPQDASFPDDLYYIIKMPQVEDWHDFFLRITDRIAAYFESV